MGKRRGKGGEREGRAGKGRGKRGKGESRGKEGGGEDKVGEGRGGEGRVGEAIPKKGHFQFFLDPKGALLQHKLKSYFAFSLSFFSCMIHW